MTTLRKYLCLIFAIVLVFSNTVNLAGAQGPTNFANCRLGVGGITNNVVGYNMSQLNLGRYLDWGARNPRPAGLAADIEYILMVRVHQAKADYGSGWYGPPRVYLDPPSYHVKPSLSTITTIAQSQPGMLWLIGNEIERVDYIKDGGYSGQDEITPAVYATAFHEIRNVIKTADPTARIAIGSIIEPTPLRLAYLDRVWDSYYNQYGYSMGQDIDVWNIHGFIIREVLNDWGAEIPAGFNNNDSDLTNNYDPADAFLATANFQTLQNAHQDINYYRQHIENFRAWMAAHGERHKPLLNSEYGILMDLNNTEVINFLNATFDYMFSATNANTGYPADENRLIQGWVWYSLNDNTGGFQEGTLFNANKGLKPVGNAWKSYVTNPAKPLASQPRRNLLVTNLSATPTAPPSQNTPITLKVDVSNSGNTKTATGNNIVIKFWNGVPNQGGSTVIASQILADLPGCAQPKTVTANWSKPIGTHTWYAEVVQITGETSASDNIASHTFTVQGNLQANLAVAKTVDIPTPHAGGFINYSITATNNNGPHMVANVRVNDLLPAGLIFDSYTATQGNYYSSGVWEVGVLAKNASAVLTIRARVGFGQAGQTITNIATITNTSPYIDSNLNNNSASVNIVPKTPLSNFLPILLK